MTYISERELIVEEIHRRLSEIENVLRCVRNPVDPPADDEYPANHLFERDDVIQNTKHVTKNGLRYPVHQRLLHLALEVLIKGSSAGAASKELNYQLSLARAAIFVYGEGVNGLGEVKEAGSATAVYALPDSRNIQAIGIGLEVTYIEDLSRLFE